MSSATVLYDAPGPRARARNRVLSVVTVVVVVLLVGGVLFLMFDTGQFSAGWPSSSTPRSSGPFCWATSRR